MLAVGALTSPTGGRAAGSLLGVSAAGADFAVGARFDSDESFAFYASRGHRLVRLPFLWESLQPRPGAALDRGYIESLRAAVASCTSRGMVCVLDLHNYGRHGEAVIGDGDLTGGDLADLWTRLVDELARDEAIADGLVELGLMNEPHDMPGGAASWERTVQESVTAIRRAGAENTVRVSGEQWSSAASWAEVHPRWWVEDPLGRSGPEGHYYFDAGNLHQGTYPGRYDDDESVARELGFDSLPHKVEEDLGGFVRYCRREGVRGFLGEIGWPHDGPAASHPDDAPRWDDLGRTAYAVLTSGGLDVAHWAAGEQWGEDYNLSVYLGTPQQAPTSAAAVLEQHTAPAAGAR